MNNDLISIINQLIDYYKELNNLKEAGIDISKLAAHKLIYSMYVQYLINHIGLNRALSIMKYAECPVDSVEDFIQYLDREYPVENNTDTVTRPDTDTVTRLDTNEFDKTIDETTHSTDCNEKLCTSDCSSCYQNEKYYVNGKKVAKDAYDEAVAKFSSILTKFFKSIDE